MSAAGPDTEGCGHPNHGGSDHTCTPFRADAAPAPGPASQPGDAQRALLDAADVLDADAPLLDIVTASEAAAWLRARAAALTGSPDTGEGDT